MGVLRPIIFTAIVLQVCLMTYGVLVYVSPPAVADGVGRGGAASRVRAVSDTLPSRKRSAMSRIAAALTRAVSRGGRAGRSPREIIAAVLKRRATHARAVTLLVVSDWGLRGRGLMRVTGAVQKICETRRRGANKDLGSDPASIAEARRRRNLGPVTAMASLGDNFYYFGVKSRKDRLFDDVYGTSFGTGCTSKLNFWSIAGNHCYRGSVSALLQRDVIVSAQREAKKGGAGGKAGQTPKSPRGSGGGKSHDQDGTVDISSANVAIARRHGWRMPARSYVVQLPTGRIIDALGGPRDPAPIVDGLAAAGPRARGRVETNAPLGVRLIFIDTNPLVCLPVEAGPRSRECEVMHSLDSANETEEVIAWLRRVAKEAHDDPDTHWFAVLGHHPVASNVRRDCTRLQAALLPHLRMFARSSKFAGYFAGHDHALQHIRRAGVDNFAVGGGGGPLQPVRRDARAHDTKPWTPRAGAPREQAPFSQRETVFTMPGFGFMELRATRSSWHSLIRNADGEVVHRFTKRRRVRAKGGKGKDSNKDGKRDEKRDDKRDRKTKDNRRTPAAAVDLGSRGKAAKTRASTKHEDTELA